MVEIEEEKRDQMVEASRIGIEDTAFEMLKTSNQPYGMIRTGDDF